MAKTREERNADNRAYYHKNKERINKRRSEYGKKQHRRKTYGLTPEAFDAMFEEQEGRCAICGTAIGLVDRDLAVDHCHDTDKVRGLLCRLCNLGIGYFRDRPELLDKAKAYLT